MLQQVPARAFRRIVVMTRKSHLRFAENLTLHTTDEYSLYRCYTVSNASAGYAIKGDGELINVFNNTGIKGFGDILVQSAIANGAKYLDCLDGKLTEFYASHGFVEYRREKNWTEGQPDVVWMRYVAPQKFLTLYINGSEIQIPA